MFGCIPSPYDSRDFVFSAITDVTTLTFPAAYSTKDGCTPIRNQGPYGTCVAHAGEGMKGWQEKRNYPTENLDFSPAFMYTECKKRDGIPTQAGTHPRILMDVLKNLGACKEVTMPYNVMTSDITLPVVPNVAYEEAKKYVISAYARLLTIDDVKAALQASGPILLAVMVTESFMSPVNGKYIPMPNGKIVGGHAINCVGWDDTMEFDGHTGFLEIRNSWGTGWGDGGYAWMPYDFFTGKLDIGVPYVYEAWSTVDLVAPRPGAKQIICKINDPNIIVDGVSIKTDQPPIIMAETGRTMLPSRFFAENMGYAVSWDSKNQTVTFNKLN